MRLDTLDDKAPPCDIMDPETGKPRLLSAQCLTCIGRPGNPMDLRPGRVRQMVRDALTDGSQGIVCHETVPYRGNPAGRQAALCRWFWQTYGYRVNFIRVMARLGGWKLVDPPAPARSPDGD